MYVVYINHRRFYCEFCDHPYDDYTDTEAVKVVSSEEEAGWWTDYYNFYFAWNRDDSKGGTDDTESVYFTYQKLRPLGDFYTSKGFEEACNKASEIW